MKQAIRVDDDERDSGGMGAAGYVVALLFTVGFSLLIAAVLWLPRWWGW